VVFRSLDIGGDKVLPYLDQGAEENPALGWRALRMALDRPALFRTQIRAFLRAGAGRDLSVMIPMVTTPEEIDAARALFDKEVALLAKRGHKGPERLRVGAMIEVPSLLFDLDRLMPRVDFVSIGSNDLSQFLFAADRGNARVARRYDSLSLAMLKGLRAIIKAGKKYDVPVTLCGEMAGRPLEAMALIGLGLRSISMAPASIGPVKSMILGLNAGRVGRLLDEVMRKGQGSARAALQDFALRENLDI
jgi:phosphotransferase system, enzyme I, PtsP